MKNFALFSVVPAVVITAFCGCSSLSKVASNISNKKNDAQMARNPEQMRVAIDGAIFQPISRVEMPQFQGIQTPLAGGGRQRLQSSTPRAVTLPRFTPVKVLSTNSRYVLVEIARGARGFLPVNSIAKESVILASARPATLAQPLYGSIDPATGMPYPQSNGSLYLPEMDTADAPVDEAMLNNIDSIPLPESEKHLTHGPEAQEVDGVILRKSSDAPAAKPGLANSGDDFSSLP